MKLSTRKSRNKSGNFNCDICNEPHILVTHHINGRKIKNKNKPSNLIDICSNCHNKIHHGLIIVEQWVNTTNGKELLWHDVNQPALIKDSEVYIYG